MTSATSTSSEAYAPARTPPSDAEADAKHKEFKDKKLPAILAPVMLGVTYGIYQSGYRIVGPNGVSHYDEHKVNQFIKKGATRPVEDFNARQLNLIMTEHPELANELAARNWFAKGSFQAPPLGKVGDLPAGGAEISVPPNQAVEVPLGTILEANEDGSFAPEMSGAIQQYDGPCSEGGSIRSVQLTEGVPYQYKINDNPDGIEETAQ